MPEFRLTWQIDEDASDPRAAAMRALRRMANINLTDPCSASVFTWENVATGETGILDLAE